MRRWLVDGNNVFGSRPDGWWNDRPGAATRLAEHVARWCIGHDDDVVLVFDRPAGADALGLAGGNLRIEEASRRGRDGADDRLVELADEQDDELADDGQPLVQVVVVTSDKGLINRLPAGCGRMSVGAFRRLIDY